MTIHHAAGLAGRLGLLYLMFNSPRLISWIATGMWVAAAIVADLVLLKLHERKRDANSNVLR